MTVKELVAWLLEQDQDADVILADFSGHMELEPANLEVHTAGKQIIIDLTQ